MKLKKAISFLLAIVLMLTAGATLALACSDELYYAELAFKDGVGPETEGYAIDYVYYSRSVVYGSYVCCLDD